MDMSFIGFIYIGFICFRIGLIRFHSTVFEHCLRVWTNISQLFWSTAWTRCSHIFDSPPGGYQDHLTVTNHFKLQGSKQRKFVREGFGGVFRTIWMVFLEVLPFKKSKERQWKKNRRPFGVTDNGHDFPSTHQLINPLTHHQLINSSTHQPIDSSTHRLSSDQLSSPMFPL